MMTIIRKHSSVQSLYRWQH